MGLRIVGADDCPELNETGCRSRHSPTIPPPWYDIWGSGHWYGLPRRIASHFTERNIDDFGWFLEDFGNHTVGNSTNVSVDSVPNIATCKSAISAIQVEGPILCFPSVDLLISHVMCRWQTVVSSHPIAILHGSHARTVFSSQSTSLPCAEDDQGDQQHT